MRTTACFLVGQRAMRLPVSRQITRRTVSLATIRTFMCHFQFGWSTARTAIHTRCTGRNSTRPWLVALTSLPLASANTPVEQFVRIRYRIFIRIFGYGELWYYRHSLQVSVMVKLTGSSSETDLCQLGQIVQVIRAVCGRTISIGYVIIFVSTVGVKYGLYCIGRGRRFG